jgi:NADH:ubiquinone oxidoreductase subunit 6 (subunit J)
LLLLFAAIASPVLFLGATTTPVTSPGVLADGAYDYHGPRPTEHFTRDPIGSMTGDSAYEAYAADALRSGTLPFWNPYQGLGSPFLADPSSKLFYAPNLLRLIVPPAYWDLFGLAHLFMAGVFIFLYCREVWLTVMPSLLAGAGVYGMGHFLMFLPATSIIQTAAWAPLLLYAVERTIARADNPCATAFIAAVGTYALWTGGHLSPAIIITVSVALYSIIRFIQTPTAWRRFALTIIGFLTGFLLAAPAWLNFLNVIVEDQAARNSGYSVRYALPDLAGFFVPNLFGAINTPLSSAVDGWGMGYVPPFLTFLAVIGFAGLSRRGRAAPQLWALLIISVFWIGWGMDLPGFIILRQLPFFGRLNPNYLWSIPSITLCVAAGAGLARLLEADAAARRRLLVVWLGGVVALIAVSAYSIPAAFVRMPGLSSDAAQRSVIPAVVWFGLCCLILIIDWKQKQEDQAGPLVAVAFAGVTLSAVAYFPSGDLHHAILVRKATLAVFAIIIGACWLFRSSRTLKGPASWMLQATIPAAAIAAVTAVIAPGLPNRTDAFARAPYIEWLQKATQATGDRVYGIGGTLFPNVASIFGISSVNLLTAMVPAWDRQFFETSLDPTQRAEQFFGLPGGAGTGPAEQMLLNRGNWNNVSVRYFVGSSLTLDFLRINSEFQVHQFIDASSADVRPTGFLPASGVALEGETDCKDGSFAGLEIIFATFARVNQGSVELVARRGDEIVARATIDSAQIRDNVPSFLYFDRAPCQPGGGPLQLQLSYHGAVADGALLAWQHGGQGSFAFRRFLDVERAPPTKASYQPIPFSEPIRMKVHCPAPGEIRTSLRLSTYGRSNAGSLIVEYTDAAGHVSRTESDTSKLIDNAFASTPPVQACTRGGEDLTVLIRFQPANPQSGLANWWDPEDRVPLVLPMIMGSGALRLAYSDAQTGVEVWENVAAKPRVYLATASRVVSDWQAAQDAFARSDDPRGTAFLEPAADWQCPISAPGKAEMQISNIAVEPNRVSATVEARSAGVLVLTDLWMPGWRATVDGAEQPVARVNGVFRGTCLAAPGRHTVVFTFEPPLFRVSLALAGFAALSLVVLGWRGTRPRRRSDNGAAAGSEKL